MTCWRCGRLGDHASWCSMTGGCGHCGWSPCRWWCLGEEWRPVAWSAPRDPHGRFHQGGGVMLEPRLRSELHAEIAQENHAIAEIEKKLANTGPILLRACAWCSAVAVDECRACEESVCQDCALWSGCYVFCPDCVGGAR